MLGTSWLKGLRIQGRGVSKAARTARRRTARYRTGRLGLVESLESRTLLTPAIASFDLYADTGTPGDYATSDPRVTGTVTSSYSGSATLEFDYDGDGSPDNTGWVDANGVFVHDPESHVQLGSVTIQVRAVEMDWQTFEMNYSAWSTLTYTWQNLAPQVDSFDVLNPPAGHPGVTLDGLLTGTVSNPDGQVGSVTIEVDYNGDDVPDTYVSVNADGTFTYDMNGGPGYGLHTIRVRGLDCMPGSATGEWVSLDVSYIAPPQMTGFFAENVGWHRFELSGYVDYYDLSMLTIQFSGVVEGSVSATSYGSFYGEYDIHEEGYVYVVAIDEFGRETDIWREWILLT
jgi:hypothetical protein